MERLVAHMTLKLLLRSKPVCHKILSSALSWKSVSIQMTCSNLKQSVMIVLLLQDSLTSCLGSYPGDTLGIRGRYLVMPGRGPLPTPCTHRLGAVVPPVLYYHLHFFFPQTSTIIALYNPAPHFLLLDKKTCQLHPLYLPFLSS